MSGPDIQRLLAFTRKALEETQAEVFESPPHDWADFKLRQGRWLAYRELHEQTLLILKTDEEDT